jgi:hypothetical protein
MSRSGMIKRGTVRMLGDVELLYLSDLQYVGNTFNFKISFNFRSRNLCNSERNKNDKKLNKLSSIRRNVTTYVKVCPAELYNPRIMVQKHTALTGNLFPNNGVLFAMNSFFVGP